MKGGGRLEFWRRGLECFWSCYTHCDYGWDDVHLVLLERRIHRRKIVHLPNNRTLDCTLDCTTTERGRRVRALPAVIVSCPCPSLGLVYIALPPSSTLFPSDLKYYVSRAMLPARAGTVRGSGLCGSRDYYIGIV
ncbi:hypothetical protein SISSUDRAFT_93529 [Sistotremastrum suecicum HHB10207 ss-3]|uniref:Uncharacterized protein n=1 Tax=Sistotremastrum suecicum HHB10207 ss-3 TaxID=1314776 RepID=A0A166B9R1_9AGAM|nr:hypothetical protein SISSUDRAFT_93529 [Sistotremastrum suecicum HHB10207 ss-3]